MNKMKIIKTFCIISLCTGTLVAVEKAVESLTGQTVPELAAVQQAEPIALPQDKPGAQDIPGLERQAPISEEQGVPPVTEPIVTPVAETTETKVQEPEPVIPQVQPQSPTPAAVPITRVLAPGQDISELSPKIKSKPKISLNEQQAKPQFAARQDAVEDDTKALKDLAARSQDAKRHTMVPPPDDSDERIEFQFENTDLQKVIQQVGDLFNVTFIPTI